MSQTAFSAQTMLRNQLHIAKVFLRNNAVIGTAGPPSWRRLVVQQVRSGRCSS
jgi:hypothetical protein